MTENAEMDRLIRIKQNGDLLTALDERRLRNHQLRVLRRQFLKDQVISAREPVMPNPKINWHNWRVEWVRHEENFWKKTVKYRNFVDWMGDQNRTLKDFTKMMLYKTQRNVRTGACILALTFPVYYWYEFHLKPNFAIYSPQVVMYPGEETVKGNLQDFEWDMKTFSYKLKEDKK